MTFIDRAIYKFFKAQRSYSQSGEDRIISLLFNSFNKTKIRYLDIGANHPKEGSNTYLFYCLGGSGVCVEPNPELARLIRKNRPTDVCLNVGVGIDETQHADFYVMSSNPLSTFSRDEAMELDEAGKYKIEKVLSLPLKTFNQIIKENFEGPIDLVSLDVEGWNEEIVRSIDFSISRPFCFCVETLSFAEDHSGRKLTGIIDYFLQHDYKVYADTTINTIFVDRETLES
jgi:FkbM family methyltransferase